jgi:hypothetical protein
MLALTMVGAVVLARAVFGLARRRLHANGG